MLDEIPQKLDKIIHLLEILVARSEPTVPQVPKLPPIPPVVPSVSDKTTCSLCHMEFSGVMGYVCSQPNCPMSLGPVMS